MKIDVIDFLESEDGSGILQMELDKEAKEFLLEKGLNSMLSEIITKVQSEL